MYIANLFLLTSDTRAPIVMDTDVSQEDLGIEMQKTSYFVSTLMCKLNTFYKEYRLYNVFVPDEKVLQGEK